MDTFTILVILLFAIGAVQGIIFGSTLLAGKSRNKMATRLLSAILFLLAYRLIVQILRLFGLGYYDTWYYFMLDLSWASGPLLYFYAKALITPKFRFRTTDWLHFIPLVLQITFSVFVRLQNLYWDGTRESLSWLGYWGYVAWMNYATIYIIASVLIIIYTIKAQRMLTKAQQQRAIKPERVRWISRILRAFQYYFILVLVVLIVDLLIYNVALGNYYFYFERFYYYPFFSGISILTYWLGLEGFKRKDQVEIVTKPKLSEDQQDQLNEIGQALVALMQKEQLYKRPELTLSMVAEQLDIKPYLLSRAIKEVFQVKFSDYINNLRVAEVQRLIADPQNEHYTLLSLAMDAGFNSKSSFNRAVKKHLGISPSELKHKQ